jgi:hypothetical protein
MLLQAEQMHKMTLFHSKYVVEVVILSVAQLEQQSFSSQLEISHVLNGTGPEIQHRK